MRLTFSNPLPDYRVRPDPLCCLPPHRDVVRLLQPDPLRLVQRRLQGGVQEHWKVSLLLNVPSHSIGKSPFLPSSSSSSWTYVGKPPLADLAHLIESSVFPAGETDKKAYFLQRILSHLRGIALANIALRFLTHFPRIGECDGS